MSDSKGTDESSTVAGNGRVVFTGITANDRSADIFAQTHEALSNVDLRLAEVGADRSSLLMVHIWLSDMALFSDMTLVWNEWIGSDEPPSRSCVSAQPRTTGALLEVVATAADPAPGDDLKQIERYGMVKGPGRPTMCLGLAHGDWFTVCLTPPDCRSGISDQTGQILQKLDGYLEEAGFDKASMQTAEIWLKNLHDTAAVERVWNQWLGPLSRPDIKVMRADMASPEMLIEIRITASRSC